MMYPTSDYIYADENTPNVEPSRFVQHVYADNNDPSMGHILPDENMYDASQQQSQYRPVTTDGSQPLAKCSVLYLGTAISSPGQRGIDAIQEPLSRRYPVDGKEVVRGIEAWLSIYDNGLQLQFARDPSVVLFYPIRSLVYCASIRFATRTQTGAEFPNGWRFVPLDSPAAARVENTRNPPLFAVTFRRTRHLPVDECHCFVTKTKQAALALVQACFSAYQATTSQQDCTKVPLYFKVDDYGSKNKEIDSEIRIIPAPDRERTLDYQTNIEGGGFYYKTDRVPIDTWQLWEHHKHEHDRPASKHHRATPCSCSSKDSSSSASSSSSSSCSSCHHSRRSRRRRLASIASIPALHQQQPQPFLEPDSQSFSANTVPSITTTATTPTTQQTSVDPYAPAPNLIRVERIKDVNSGQDVFIRWVSENNSTSTVNDDQPQQIYSTQPPRLSRHTHQQFDQELENDIEHLALEDEHLRRSLHFDERPASMPSNNVYRKYKKRSKHRDSESQAVDYEVVNGFFEDRHGRRRPVKLDRPQMTTVKDFRHMHNDIVDSSAPGNDGRQRRRYRQRATSFIQPPILEPPSTYPIPPYSLTSPRLSRPFGPPYFPRTAPFYPPQTLSSAPLFPQTNFISRMPLSHPPYWYRPM